MTSSAPRSAAPATPTASVRTRTAALLDVVAVLVFVVLGRSSHAEGGLVLGTLATAWPFLLGLAAGWALLVVGRWSPAAPVTGVALTAATVAIGMLARHLLTGRGTPVSFVVVACIVLTLFLVGWRVGGRAAVRRRAGRRA